MDFEKEVNALVEKAKAEQIDLESIIDVLESVQETLQEELEESQKEEDS